MSAKGKRNLAWIRLVLIVVILGFSTYRMGSKLTSRPAPASGILQVELERTVDGDTAWFTDTQDTEYKVRFIGIDAPENGTSAYFESGLAAARLLEQAVSIELEPEPSKPQDKHGRLLAWIWLTMPDGQRILLQEEMMRSGLVDLYRDARGSLYFDRLERISTP